MTYQKLNIQSIPLHVAQQEVFFDQITNSESPHYNVGGYLMLKGKVDPNKLRIIIQSITKTFDIFQYRPVMEQNGPQLQACNNKHQFNPTIEVDFQNEDAPVEQAKKWMQDRYNEVFSLEADFLYEHALLQINAEEWWIFVRYHHLVTDAFGFTIITEYISQKYSDLVKLEKDPSAESKTFTYPQYINAVAASHQYIDSPSYQKDAHYWQEKFQQLPKPLLRKNYRAVDINNLGSVSFVVPEDCQFHIKKLIERTKASLQQLTLAAMSIYYGQTRNEQSFTFGIPVHNRKNRQERNTVGMFVGVIPFQSRYEEETSVNDLIQWIKKEQRIDYRYRSYPISHLNRSLKLHTQKREQVFDVVVNYIPFQLDIAIEGLQCQIKRLNASRGASAAPLEIRWCDYGPQQALELEVDFQKAYFTEEEVELLVNRIYSIFAQFQANANASAKSIHLLPEKEKNILLGLQSNAHGNWFNNWKEDLGPIQTINHRFEQIVAQYPNQKAIIHQSSEWTFTQVNQTANQIAHQLIELGLQPGDFVGVYLDRSPKMIAALLGIIKSGGVYVPIDPQNPEERIEQMIEESQMKILIGQLELVKRLHLQNLEAMILIDPTLPKNIRQTIIPTKDWTSVKKQPIDNPVNKNSLDSWAYMLYTSGSTGKPKGAITRHDGAMNHLLAEYEAMELEDGFCFLQSAGIGSDISIWQILGPLLKGGPVVIIDRFDLLDYDKVLEVLKNRAINVVEFVPSYLEGLLAHVQQVSQSPNLEALRWIMMVGEAVPRHLVENWRMLFPSTRILNAYGPCETSDDVTQYEVPDKLPKHYIRVPIGQPIANMNIAIVDSNGSLCPIGEVGEICTSGVGVGAGYYGMQERTASSFVDNPFAALLGDVLYKTGDLGRWLPDGNIDFIGRLDRQVKIHGNRVELGEIEAYLNHQKLVKNCHVLPYQNATGSSKLLAFLALDEQKIESHQCLIGATFTKQLAKKMLDLSNDYPSLASKTLDLDKGLKVFSLNHSETIFAFHEIFEEQAYLQHGIQLKPGAIVFDVGANMGMFSMFVSLHFPGSTIYAFEPIPPTFDLMKANTDLYSNQSEVIAYQAGLSDKTQTATFTHYPENTMLSGRYGDLDADKGYVRNVLERQLQSDQEIEENDIRQLVDKAMYSEEYKCDLLSLSEVIQQHDIPHIDLLKIDVERSELDVLAGIAAQDWDKIRQMVIEVHDDGKSLGLVKNLLKEKGFHFSVEQEDLLVGTDLYNIYAIRLNEYAKTSKQAMPELIGLADISQSLSQKCQEGMPSFMQPKDYCIVDQIPLNLSDKVDTKRLLEIYKAQQQFQQTPIATADAKNQMSPIERQLATIWEALLQEENIGVEDDFFDLGGHSLLIMRVKSAIAKTLKISVDIQDLFKHTTIGTLANFLATKSNQQYLPKIHKRTSNEKLPLSYSQERLWFIDQLEGSIHYHMPAVFTLEGKLDAEVLEYAFQQIINRHEVLRTVFVKSNNEIYQQILPENSWQLAYYENTQIDLDHFLIEKIQAPFNLAKDHMLRAHLIKQSEKVHHLVFILHHIAADGWSESILVHELITFYEAKLQAKAPALAPLDIQYADYALWQKRHLAGQQLEQQLQYWQKQLEGNVPLNLPTDFARPMMQSTKGKSRHYQLNDALKNTIKETARKEGVTLFMFLLAAFKVLMHRYSGQEDICIGSPVANRMQSETEALIGFFVNTLALRSRVEGSMTFSQFLGEVKNTTLSAYDHQDVPFEKVVERVVKKRDTSKTPLFQVLFTLQNNPTVPDLQLGAVNFIPKNIAQTTAKFSLDIDINEVSDGLNIHIDYCSDLFLDISIQQMLERFEALLKSIVANPKAEIAHLNILPQSERAVLLGQKANAEGIWFNRGKQYIDNRWTIDRRFEQIVEQFPDALAVIHGAESRSYTALNQLANQIGHCLQNNGLQQGDLVAVYSDRNPDLMATLMGIFKSGGIYLPLDTLNPKERVEAMLKKSRPRFLITNSQLVQKINTKGLETILFLDEFPSKEENRYKQAGSILLDRKVVEGMPTSKVPNTNRITHPAYVLHTSGSTGTPKGAIIRHDGALNHILAEFAALDLKDGFRFLQSAGIGSDISLWQMLAPILKGGASVIIDKNDLLDFDRLLSIIQSQGINLVEFVPTYARSLIDHMNHRSEKPIFDQLNCLLLSGEEAAIELVNDWKKAYPEIRLINCYGPCEASDDVTQYEIKAPLDKRSMRVPIGRPIPNINLFVLDAQQQLCPIGVPGELCISGVGVGDGYLGMPEKTSKQFTRNPFPDTLGKILYRTGDLGRWLPDGNLEFLGRIDRQVKIRGNRVELGEIDAIVRQTPMVQDSHLMVHKSSQGIEALIAFIVPVSSEHQEQSKIKNAIYLRCQDGLPAYMQPTHVCFIDVLPRNISDKVDELALSQYFQEQGLGSSLALKTYTAPRSATEFKLASIWENVLGFAPIGIYDNFFELGGHSMLVPKLKTSVDEAFNLLLPVQQVFNSPTIESFARAIDHGLSTDYPIDLFQEAQFNSPITLPPPSPKVLEANNILLTGATGFVGSYLLKELLEDKDNTVFCLIRCESEAHGWQRIINKLSALDLWQSQYKQRIKIVPGDIATPRLGLSETRYQQLSKVIHIVIHNATYMNHLATYQHCKTANVLGTESMIHFCTAKQLKSLHYISTVDIFNAKKGSKRTISEKHPIEQEVHYHSNGYASSKWVAEKLIQQAAAAGLPCSTHRLGLVTWEQQQKRYADNQWLSQLLKSCELLGAYPASNLAWHFQSLAVDQIAGQIVACVHPSSTEKVHQVFHHVAKKRQSLEDLIKTYYGSGIVALERLEAAEWLSLAKTKTLPVSSILALIDEVTQTNDDHDDVFISNEYTRRYLSKSS